MQHEQWCQQKALPHEDAAKRLSDGYNLHRLGMGDAAIGRWFAARLNDGTSDQTLYDNKRDAVSHQHHSEQFYAFIKIVPSDMTPCAAAVLLKTNRALYDAGMRMADPDDRHGGKDVIKRVTIEDQMNQSRGRNTNLIMPWEAN
jgi:hypothetical protein